MARPRILGDSGGGTGHEWASLLAVESAAESQVADSQHDAALLRGALSRCTAASRQRYDTI